MWLHYILYKLWQCTLPLQMWLHYILLHTVSHCVHYLCRCGCAIYLTHYHSVHCLADVAALYTLHTIIVYIALQLWLHYIHYIQSQCMLPLQVWLHYILYIQSLCVTFADVAALYTLHTVTVLSLQVWLHYILYIQSLCVLPLQMWLHYILYIQLLCVLSLQVWLHYILYIVTVCVTFAGVAALYTLHTLCKHYLCRCGYTCARLPCCSTWNAHCRQLTQCRSMWCSGGRVYLLTTPAQYIARNQFSYACTVYQLTTPAQYTARYQYPPTPVSVHTNTCTVYLLITSAQYTVSTHPHLYQYTLTLAQYMTIY